MTVLDNVRRRRTRSTQASSAPRRRPLLREPPLRSAIARPWSSRTRRRSASSSRARSPRARSCCCSTSRQAGSVTRRSSELGDVHRATARRLRADDPARRAPHGAGHERRRPRARARLRQEDRRRHPTEVQANPAVIEAYLGTQSSRSRRTWRHCCELDDVEARYGPVQALHGVLARRSATASWSRVLGANGAGRRRRCARSPARCAAAATSCFAGKKLRAVRMRRRARRSRTFPRAAAPSASSRSGRTLRLGAYARRANAQDGGAACSTSSSRGWKTGATSRPARSPAASSRCSRSAARSWRRPKLLLARRAVARPCSDRSSTRSSSVLDALNETRGPDGARRRAEREPRAQRRAARLRARGRQSSSSRARATSCVRTNPSASRTSATDARLRSSPGRSSRSSSRRAFAKARSTRASRSRS